MNKKIRIALLGLGAMGETFAEHFLEKIHADRIPVEIVAVAHDQPDSAVALGFAHSKVPVFRDPADVLKMGDKIDIIFDLSEDTRVRQNLRLKLIETKNLHTAIAPDVFARLLWYFFDEPMPQAAVA